MFASNSPSCPCEWLRWLGGFPSQIEAISVAALYSKGEQKEPSSSSRRGEIFKKSQTWRGEGQQQQQQQQHPPRTKEFVS